MNLMHKMRLNVPRKQTRQIGHFRDGFYRPHDPTNSVKALKEAGSSTNTPYKADKARYRPLWDVTIAARHGAEGRLFLLIHSLHSLAQLAHFCLNGRSANPETPKMAEPYC